MNKVSPQCRHFVQVILGHIIYMSVPTLLPDEIHDFYKTFSRLKLFPDSMTKFKPFSMYFML